jgi:hypothetical protein
MRTAVFDAISFRRDAGYGLAFAMSGLRRTVSGNPDAMSPGRTNRLTVCNGFLTTPRQRVATSGAEESVSLHVFRQPQRPRDQRVTHRRAEVIYWGECHAGQRVTARPAGEDRPSPPLLRLGRHRLRPAPRGPDPPLVPAGRRFDGPEDCLRVRFRASTDRS